MKVKKNSKYQTHKKSIKLTKNLNDGTGALKGDLSHFWTSIVAKHQKIEEGPFGEKKIPKKVSQCRKNWKGGPFGVARYGMLRGKTENLFGPVR